MNKEYAHLSKHYKPHFDLWFPEKTKASENCNLWHRHHDVSYVCVFFTNTLWKIPLLCSTQDIQTTTTCMILEPALITEIYKELFIPKLTISRYDWRLSR